MNILGQDFEWYSEKILFTNEQTGFQVKEIRLLDRLLYIRFLICGRTIAIYQGRRLALNLARTNVSNIEVYVKMLIDYCNKYNYNRDKTYLHQTGSEDLFKSIASKFKITLTRNTCIMDTIVRDVSLGVNTIIEQIDDKLAFRNSDKIVHNLVCNVKPIFVAVRINSGNSYMAKSDNIIKIGSFYYHKQYSSGLIGQCYISHEWHLHTNLYPAKGAGNQNIYISRNFVSTCALDVDGTYYLNNEATKDFYGIDICGEHGIPYIGNCPACVQENVVNIYGYHCGCGREFRAAGKPIRIGIELEKEDNRVKKRLPASKLLKSTGWVMERDSSLHAISGFELVSPILGLELEPSVYEQIDFLGELSIVREYIDAKYSDRCGGHINISLVDESPSDIAHSIRGYFPLLYSLYPSRNQHYSRFKRLDEYTDDKYATIRGKDNGVMELRIFPAVTNYENLLWRCELVRIMLVNDGNSSQKVLAMLANKSSELYRHLLRELHSDKMLTLISDYVANAQMFNAVKYTVSPSEMVYSVINGNFQGETVKDPMLNVSF